jgi:alpha-beta hydrolase superfamily lysophospholipase
LHLLGSLPIEAYFTDLRKLIERTHKRNDDTPIIFFAHGLGAPLTLTFLAKQTEVWRNKYVRAMISIGGPFGGTAVSMQSIITGENNKMKVTQRR